MWKDVVTGRTQQRPGEPLMPGQWVFVGSGAISIQDARAVSGALLLPGSDGKAGLVEYQNVACNPRLVWDDAAIRTMANVAGRLDAIRDLDWSRWLQEPPVLPAINKSLDETDIEREIAKKVGYLEAACQRPRTHLENEEERIDVARCKRPAPRAMLVLATRSEDWAGRSLLEVQPKRVLGIVREEVFDTYENRLVVALVDRLDAFLASRLRAVRRVVLLLTQQADFEEKFIELNQQSRDYRRIERVCTLWGEAAESGSQREHADRVYARIRSLRRRVLGLRDSVLYRALGRQSQSRMQLRMTNILLHDDVYRRVAELWIAWETHMRHLIETPQIVWDRGQDATRGFDLFTHLVVVRALQQLGYCVDEDATGGVGQENEQLVLKGPLGQLKIEKDRIGTIVRSDAGDQIVRVIGLPAMTEAISGIGTWWNTVKSEPVVIAALSAEEVRASDEEISVMRTIRCHGDKTEALHVAIAPWDLESVERIARVLRWHIWNAAFRKYPISIPTPKEIRQEFGSMPSHLKPTREGQTYIAQVRGRTDHWMRPAELVDARQKALRDQQSVVDGYQPRDRRRTAALQVLESRRKEYDSSVEWLKCYEFGVAITEQLAMCPICFKGTDAFQSDITDTEGSQFQCGCRECGAKWGLRRCQQPDCGNRFPFLVPKGHQEPCSGHNVDRLYGADVLAFPESDETFSCPHCGKNTGG